MMKRHYFDYASTTPVDPLVIKAMEPFFFEKFGNPSSPHTIGREAQNALESARETVAHFIKAKPEEIVFNSGATEANNHAIFGVARSLKSKGNHLIVSSMEHHSVLEPMDQLKKEGFEITYLPVDSYGVISPEDVKKSITSKSILVCAIHANNEIGTIEPIADIGRITREHGVTFLVDAVQTFGHIPVNVQELQSDLLSLSAHKLYGPRGVGALYIRSGIKIAPYLLGGDQERSRRASTVNVAGVVGLAKAVEICKEKMVDEIETQTQLRNYLIQNIQERIDGAHLNGHPQKRLPNNSHFAFERIDGESLLLQLDMNGIAASMGSACKSGAMEASHVLRAIGLSDDLAYGALRLSVGRFTTKNDVDILIEKVTNAVSQLRI
jgi:cysteine desulfurase